jgi:hypothetical protein
MSSIIGISSPFPLFPPRFPLLSRCFLTAVFQAKAEPLQRDNPNPACETDKSAERDPRRLAGGGRL